MVRLADELTTSLRLLIDSSPFAGLGPIEITRTLGVDKSFTSRLMSARPTHFADSQSRTPCEAADTTPRPAPGGNDRGPQCRSPL